MVQVKDALAVAAGTIMLVVFVWSWLGRGAGARWWAKPDMTPAIVMGILPGVGLLLFAVGCSRAFGSPVSELAAPFVLLGLVAGVVGFWFPRLWAPRWFKAMHRQWRKGPRRGRAA